MAPKELLDLNAEYDSDPMRLATGDTLNIKKEVITAKAPIHGLSPFTPERYNHALNAYYEYSDTLIKGTNIKSINSPKMGKADIPIVNLKTIPTLIKSTIAFTQVTKTQSLDACWNELFCDDTPDSTKERVKNTNGHLNNPVRAGEIIILPTTDDKSAELDTLIKDATLASAGIAELTDEQAQLHQKYFEVMENKFVEYWNSGSPTDGFAAMGATVGTIASGMAKHLETVSSNLSKLDKAYLDFLSKKINKNNFIALRKSAMDTLNKSLDKLTKKTLNIPIDQDLKKVLGINSTKSLIHNAGEILENGSVEALGKRVANTAKWLKFAEGAGRVAVGLNVASGVYNVVTKCNGLESCVRESFKETGGVVGGYAGGLIGSYIGGAIVISLSITSLPVVLVVVGVPVLTMGTIGAGLGKETAEDMYKSIGLETFLKKIENKANDNIPKEVEDSIINEVEDYITNERFSAFSIPRGF